MSRSAKYSAFVEWESDPSAVLADAEKVWQAVERGQQGAAAPLATELGNIQQAVRDLNAERKRGEQIAGREKEGLERSAEEWQALRTAAADHLKTVQAGQQKVAQGTEDEIGRQVQLLKARRDLIRVDREHAQDIAKRNAHAQTPALESIDPAIVGRTAIEEGVVQLLREEAELTKEIINLTQRDEEVRDLQLRTVEKRVEEEERLVRLRQEGARIADNAKSDAAINKEIDAAERAAQEREQSQTRLEARQDRQFRNEYGAILRAEELREKEQDRLAREEEQARKEAYRLRLAELGVVVDIAATERKEALTRLRTDQSAGARAHVAQAIAHEQRALEALVHEQYKEAGMRDLQMQKIAQHIRLQEAEADKAIRVAQAHGQVNNALQSSVFWHFQLLPGVYQYVRISDSLQRAAWAVAGGYWAIVGALQTLQSLQEYLQRGADISNIQSGLQNVLGSSENVAEMMVHQANAAAQGLITMKEAAALLGDQLEAGIDNKLIDEIKKVRKEADIPDLKLQSVRALRALSTIALTQTDQAPDEFIQAGIKAFIRAQGRSLLGIGVDIRGMEKGATGEEKRIAILKQLEEIAKGIGDFDGSTSNSFRRIRKTFQDASDMFAKFLAENDPLRRAMKSIAESTAEFFHTIDFAKLDQIDFGAMAFDIARLFGALVQGIGWAGKAILNFIESIMRNPEAAVGGVAATVLTGNPVVGAATYGLASEALNADTQIQIGVQEGLRRSYEQWLAESEKLFKAASEGRKLTAEEVRVARAHGVELDRSNRIKAESLAKMNADDKEKLGYLQQTTATLEALQEDLNGASLDQWDALFDEIIAMAGNYVDILSEGEQKIAGLLAELNDIKKRLGELAADGKGEEVGPEGRRLRQREREIKEELGDATGDGTGIKRTGIEEPEDESDKDKAKNEADRIRRELLQTEISHLQMALDRARGSDELLYERRPLGEQLKAFDALTAKQREMVALEEKNKSLQTAKLALFDAQNAQERLKLKAEDARYEREQHRAELQSRLQEPTLTLQQKLELMKKVAELDRSETREKREQELITARVLRETRALVREQERAAAQRRLGTAQALIGAAPNDVARRQAEDAFYAAQLADIDAQIRQTASDAFHENLRRPIAERLSADELTAAIEELTATLRGERLNLEIGHEGTRIQRQRDDIQRAQALANLEVSLATTGKGNLPNDPRVRQYAAQMNLAIAELVLEAMLKAETPEGLPLYDDVALKQAELNLLAARDAMDQVNRELRTDPVFETFERGLINRLKEKMEGVTESLLTGDLDAALEALKQTLIQELASSFNDAVFGQQNAPKGPGPGSILGTLTGLFGGLTGGSGAGPGQSGAPQQTRAGSAVTSEQRGESTPETSGTGDVVSAPSTTQAQSGSVKQDAVGTTLGGLSQVGGLAPESSFFTEAAPYFAGALMIYQLAQGLNKKGIKVSNVEDFRRAFHAPESLNTPANILPEGTAFRGARAFLPVGTGAPRPTPQINAHIAFNGDVFSVDRHEFSSYLVDTVVTEFRRQIDRQGYPGAEVFE